MFIVNSYIAVFFLIELAAFYSCSQYMRTDVSGISHWRSLATADTHANRKVAANIITIFVIHYNINYDHNALNYHTYHKISSIFPFFLVN